MFQANPGSPVTSPVRLFLYIKYSYIIYKKKRGEARMAKERHNMLKKGSKMTLNDTRAKIWDTEKID